MSTNYANNNIIYNSDTQEEFNWAAFLLPIIWGIRFKVWVTLFVIPILILSFSFAFKLLLFVIFQIYCGANGNKWAYQKGSWKNPSDFKNTQLRWEIFAVILNILIPFIIMQTFADFLTKDTQNPRKFARNALCSVSYKKLKNELPDTVFTRNSTASDIAKQIKGDDKNAKAVGDSIVYNSKNFSRLFVSMTIFKIEDTDCTLYNKNCRVETNYVQAIETDGLDECRFIFDDKKDVIPDEDTAKAIAKGFNIFNYL